jgi:glycosyltransferase involved in cell wall biosynthesis
MKKIVFVVSTPYTAKAFLENHFEKLSQYYEIHLIANLNEEEIKNYNHPKLTSIKHIQIERKISLVKDMQALWQTTTYLKQNKFDTVICFTPKAGLIGITASWLARVKNRIHFFTGQVWHTKKGIFKIFLKMLDIIVVTFSTKIIVDGKPQQDYLIENNIISKQNSITLGKGTISGIDIDRFSPNPEVRILQRNLLGYVESDFVFLFLGRLNKDKGIFDLVTAFNKLQEKYPNVKLLVVGPDEEDIEYKIKNSSYANNSIQFYGSTNQPESIFQAVEVFCLPSHREAFGLSIIEASACGVPIICSDTYGLDDSVVNDFTGLRHKTHDAESIFESMETLYLNKEKRNTFGENGREYVVKHFSKDTITNLWASYLQAIIK